MPAIPQGSGTYDRLGNNIRLMKLVVRGIYMYRGTAPADADAQTLSIRQLILKQRDASADRVLGGAYEPNNLLENSQPFLGTPMNVITPVNKNAFACAYDDTFKLTKALSNPAATGVVGYTHTATADNNLYKDFEIVLTFGKTGKKLEYKTSGEQQPSNFDYFMADSANELGFNSYSEQITMNYHSTAYYFDS